MQLDIVFVAELEKSLSLFREFGSSSLQSLWNSRKESATFLAFFFYLFFLLLFGALFFYGRGWYKVLISLRDYRVVN